MHRDLVDQAKRGDEEAFDALARVVGDRCMAIACRILRDSHLAEDAVQAALIVAWRELRTLRDPDRFEPWLHRILTNECYAEGRRRSRWSSNIRLLPVDGPREAAGILTVNDRDQLERAFRRLTLEQRAGPGIPAARAVEWLRALSATWHTADALEEKADLLHAIYDRIVVAGETILSARLTPEAQAHGMAVALPEVVMARPTGFERADAINIRIPIERAEDTGEATA